MIKVYGLKTCPNCDYVKKQIEGSDNFKYIDIGTNVKFMHEFIILRDNHKEFDHIKKIDIGVPAFLLEDGTIILNLEKLGLKEYNGTCCLENHRKCVNC